MINHIMYDEIDGIISALREGFLDEPTEKIEVLITFAEKVNRDLKSGKADARDVFDVSCAIHDLMLFENVEWTRKASGKIYNKLVDGIE